jgi:hypothetical protein
MILLETIKDKIEKLIDTNHYDEACELVKKEFDFSFECKYLKNDFHFDKDESTRDIYEITLKRGTREYIFNFGQSIMDSQYYQDSIKERSYTLNGQNRTGNYILHDIEKFKKSFPDGGTQKLKLIKGKEPSLYKILTCLTKYDPGTFENFCGEFGYDEDSRSAEKTYNAIKEEYMNMCKLFNDEELEILQLIN